MQDDQLNAIRSRVLGGVFGPNDHAMMLEHIERQAAQLSLAVSIVDEARTVVSDDMRGHSVLERMIGVYDAAVVFPDDAYAQARAINAEIVTRAIAYCALVDGVASGRELLDGMRAMWGAVKAHPAYQLAGAPDATE